MLLAVDSYSHCTGYPKPSYFLTNQILTKKGAWPLSLGTNLALLVLALGFTGQGGQKIWRFDPFRPLQILSREERVNENYRLFHPQNPATVKPSPSSPWHSR